MRVLITGFEPFENAPTNCTELVIQRIVVWQSHPAMAPDHPALRLALQTVVLPVADRAAGPVLHEAIDRFAPDVVIATGEAAGRTRVSVERLAINLKDYRIPDNQGVQIRDTPVVEQAPAAYFASLPIHAICDALEARGLSATITRDAGTFLCNQVMYEVLHRAARDGYRAGFLHLPLVREQIAEYATGQRRPPAPGPGVFDPSGWLAPDGSPREWHDAESLRSLERTAPELDRMALGVLDAAMLASTHAASMSR